MTTLRPWLLLASALCGVPAGAATLVVDDDSPCPGAGTAGNPYCDIQTAVDAAPASGTTILVKPGTYQECVNAVDPDVKVVALVAEDPDPSATVLDGSLCFGTSTVVLGYGSSIDGFRLTLGDEGAITSFGSVSITNNLVENNAAQSSGGGIFADSGLESYSGPATINIVIEGNTVRNNTSERDGAGIWVSPRSSGTVDAVAVVQNNVVKSNHSSGVGGGIGGITQAGLGSTASLQITQNTVQSNIVDAAPGADTDGFGGGIWVSTSGPGQETITIDHNTVGAPLGSVDNNLRNTAVNNGGGISATVFAVDTAVHAIAMESNVVRRNTASVDGGGIELFVVGDSLTLPGRYSVLISDNDIENNTTADFGGGFLADVGTVNTSSRRNPTDIVGNRINNNFAGWGGGGGEARSFAEGGPRTFCGVSLRHNTVTGNTAESGDPDNPGFAGGFSLFTQADGAGIARIDAAYNTITGNTAEIGGGGIDLAGITSSNAGGNGTTLVEISNSLIENNTGFGVGAPPDPDPPYPGIFRLTLRSSDLSPNTEGPVESTLAAHRVDVCMPASTAAERAFPGIDSDNDVDGQDLLRLATAFASKPGAVHYNPLTDLDDDPDHVVDGSDLAILSASFGDTCP